VGFAEDLIEIDHRIHGGLWLDIQADSQGLESVTCWRTAGVSALASRFLSRSRVFVDTRENCFKEAGGILVPVEEEVFSIDQVAGELSELCRESVAGRQSENEITLFKSAGCALGDPCGAVNVWRVRED
jgi:ornithine cyclodeaminase/alanine dehydrogenase-like protein (mu-crystallin family)